MPSSDAYVILRNIQLTNSIQQRIQRYKDGKKFVNEKLYQKLIDCLPGPLEGKSLTERNKKVANEWHPTKNNLIIPSQVSYGSNEKYWWKCNKEHEWKAAVNDRNNGQGCPYCSGRRLIEENSLKYLYPKISSEWHPTKNGRLTPLEVPKRWGKTVWWKCKNGHEWEASVAHRTNGTGCPYCSNRKVSSNNNLLAKCLRIAKEWHPTKNKNLTPKDVVYSSSKKMWWQCNKGHEWKASVINRYKGRGCPYCSGNKVSLDNCLHSVNPNLAKEWHRGKNAELTPKDITKGSGQKVWWKCKKGHEWKASVANRSRGRGCPFCYKENKKKAPRF